MKPESAMTTYPNIKVVAIRDEAKIRAKADLTVKRALRQAKAAKLTDVLVIGWDKGGNLFIAGHPNDSGQALYLMEVAKQTLTGMREG